jgi:hypothetical protein
MKKLLFTLLLFIGLKSFGQVTGHTVVEIVVKDPKGKLLTFTHKDKEDWDVQIKEADGITKLQFKEMDDFTDHSISLENTAMKMKLKFDLATKKMIAYVADADATTKKYHEISEISGEIVSFK